MRIVRTPRRARPPESVRIVRIATPGSTPEGCADRADRRAGLDPRRVCGLCGSPRRARSPEGVRIVRIATPGSTLEGCADRADRHAGLDPRRVCGLCGSPRRVRPPGGCADRADPPTGGQVTVRDDFPHRGIFRCREHFELTGLCTKWIDRFCWGCWPCGEVVRRGAAVHLSTGRRRVASKRVTRPCGFGFRAGFRRLGSERGAWVRGRRRGCRRGTRAPGP